MQRVGSSWAADESVGARLPTNSDTPTSEGSADFDFYEPDFRYTTISLVVNTFVNIFVFSGLKVIHFYFDFYEPDFRYTAISLVLNLFVNIFVVLSKLFILF